MDREKVIKKAERIMCSTVDRDMIDSFCEDVIAVLKEQEAVVRCEYCKHRPTPPKDFGAEINGKWCYWCKHLKSWEPDDWFCADGERKET